MIIGLFAWHRNDFILLVVIAGYSRTRTRKIIIIRVFQHDRGKEKTDGGTTIRLTFFFVGEIKMMFLYMDWGARICFRVGKRIER